MNLERILHITCTVLSHWNIFWQAVTSTSIANIWILMSKNWITATGEVLKHLIFLHEKDANNILTRNVYQCLSEMFVSSKKKE